MPRSFKNARQPHLNNLVLRLSFLISHGLTGGFHGDFKIRVTQQFLKDFGISQTPWEQVAEISARRRIRGNMPATQQKQDEQ
jgi:hypothetical protein